MTQTDHFDTDYLSMDLKKYAIRGGGVSLAGRSVLFVLDLVSIAIFAHLLTPEIFGLIAMVAVFTGFVAVFKDIGFATATVQRKEIDHCLMSTMFWLNAAIGGGVMLFTAALSPIIAWIYDEPRLLKITLCFSVTFLISGLAVQHRALLIRHMRFGRLVVINFLAEVISIVAGVILAVNGAGYWALVGKVIVKTAANTLLIWCLVRWVPGLPGPMARVGSTIAFGRNLTLSRFMNFVVRNGDNFLIGKFCGPSALGFYSKAYTLLLLPVRQINGPVGDVALPVLCRLQDDPERFRRYYCKSIALMTAFSMPLVVFAFICARELVLLILGCQWLDSVIIFRALAPAAFIGTFNTAAGWVLVPLGRTGRQLKIVCVSAVITVIAFLIGLHWGAVGVAVAFSLSVCAMILPQLAWAFRGSPLRLRDLGVSLWRPALGSLIAGSVVGILRFLGLSTEILAGDIGLFGALFGLCYVLFWLVIPGGSRPWMEIWRFRKAILDLRGKPPVSANRNK